MNICPQTISARAARPPKPGLRPAAAQPSAFSLQPSLRGFTMVEIAICLAIIGLGLVAIIGVLPRGMNVQRENREETMINEDSTVLLESIKNGVRSGTDLTNYVFAITNYWTEFVEGGRYLTAGHDDYTFKRSNITIGKGPPVTSFVLTNNARIIGLLSMPEFTAYNDPNHDTLIPTNSLIKGGFSNRVYAYVRAMNGPAVEKPPQDNSILIEDSFSYRMLAVNAPLAVDTNIFGLPQPQRTYTDQLAANLHELRLTFAWPLRPNGTVSSDGPVPQTQRTLVAGSVVQTNDNGQNLYFYQPQSFVNAP